MRHERNVIRDMVIGAAAGAIGTVVMGKAWGLMSSLANGGTDPDEQGERDDQSEWDEQDARSDEQQQSRGRGAQAARETWQAREREQWEAVTNRGEGAPGSESSGGPLDDISVTDIEPREGESAPATLGRALYERATGREPSEQTQNRLASGFHWGMGVGMGALYGLVRGRADGIDAHGGALFGAGVWAFADELAVPMLGLSEGPTAHDWTEHLQGLGAHLVYGVATAATAQALERVM